MFNERQNEAIAFGEGAAMVLAGPGTGKTTVITHRIKYLIENGIAKPEEILVVTFTKAAAEEMQERFEKLSSHKSWNKQVTFGTFHSVFYRILRETQGSFRENLVLSEEKRNRILKEIVLRLRVDYADLCDIIPMIAGEISKVKGEGKSPAHFVSKLCRQETFWKIYEEYEKSLKAENRIDFDDIILKCQYVLRQNRPILEYWQKKFRYILVDEFQDINQTQYENVKLLAGNRPNIFVVGDDDQSIYGFRGAGSEIMFAFAREFHNVRIINLNINYRSTPQILEVSKNVIGHSAKRYRKQLIASHGAGAKVDIRQFDTNIQQYQYIAERIKEYMQMGIKPSQIAVLVRNHRNIPVIHNYLVGQQIGMERKHPLYVYGHSVAKDIIAYIKAAEAGCSKSMTENIEILRIINKPYRYISMQFIGEDDMSLQKLKQVYQNTKEIQKNIQQLEFHLNMIKTLEPYAAIHYIRHGADYERYMKEQAEEKGGSYEELARIFDVIQQEAIAYKTHKEWLRFAENRGMKKEETTERKIRIMTIHAAKGLEYPVVFIPDVNQGIIPEARAIREGDIEEERRIFYVALTRASKYLHVFCVNRMMGRKYQKSQFINEMRSYLLF